MDNPRDVQCWATKVGAITVPRAVESRAWINGDEAAVLRGFAKS